MFEWHQKSSRMWEHSRLLTNSQPSLIVLHIHWRSSILQFYLHFFFLQLQIFCNLQGSSISGPNITTVFFCMLCAIMIMFAQTLVVTYMPVNPKKEIYFALFLKKNQKSPKYFSNSTDPWIHHNIKGISLELRTHFSPNIFCSYFRNFHIMCSMYLRRW